MKVLSLNAWMAAALVLAALLGARTAVAEDAKPSIFSPAPEFEFGSRDNEEKVDHSFTVINVGTAELKITDVKTTCGCTVAELKKKQLAPGEETSIDVTLNLKGKQGPQQKQITVMSNDPATPAYKLTLKGEAVPAVLVEPALANFGRVLDAQPAPQVVTIKANQEGLSFNVTGVQLAEKEFTQELKTITAGKEYAIEVSLAEGLPAGVYSGVMSVTTDSPKRPSIPIRVNAQVIGDIDVAPTQLTVQAVADPARTTTQYMRVAPGRIDEFEVTEVIAPLDSIDIELIPRGQNNYNIKVANIPGTDEIDGKEVIIKTNLESMPEIRVPFRVIKPRTPTRPATLKAN